MSLRELNEALLTSSVYNILYKCIPNRQEELKLLAEYVANIKCLCHTYQISNISRAPSTDSVLKGIETTLKTKA